MQLCAAALGHQPLAAHVAAAAVVQHPHLRTDGVRVHDTDRSTDRTGIETGWVGTCGRCILAHSDSKGRAVKGQVRRQAKAGKETGGALPNGAARGAARGARRGAVSGRRGIFTPHRHRVEPDHGVVRVDKGAQLAPREPAAVAHQRARAPPPPFPATGVAAGSLQMQLRRTDPGVCEADRVEPRRLGRGLVA